MDTFTSGCGYMGLIGIHLVLTDFRVKDLTHSQMPKIAVVTMNGDLNIALMKNTAPVISETCIP